MHPFRVAALLLSASLLSVIACSSDSPKSNPTVTPDGGGGNTVYGPACVAATGTIPAANCDSSDHTCSATSACPINEAKCGSKSTCMPMADNTGKTTVDMRMRRLNIVAPPRLAIPIVRNVVIDKSITLKAPECGENGDGSFTWLLRFDMTKNTLTTGGAPPSADPFNTGYCFINNNVAGNNIAPVTVPLKKVGTKYEADPIEKINVPIFVYGDLNNVILLPLSKVTIKDMEVSTDGNCIGTFNHGALSAACEDDAASCVKWNTAAALGGFITLEEADTVEVDPLGGQTLCVLLTGAAGPDNKKCKRTAEGKLDVQGDFCSTTNSAGGCGDAVWLSATFAASATKIHDGSTVPQCAKSGGATDAGRD